MPTPCIHCQHPLNTPGECAKCKTKQDSSSTLGETGRSSNTCLDTTTVQVHTQRARSSATQQQPPQRVHDPQIQIRQQLQARSKLTPLQPKQVKLTLPRVLDRNPSRPRLNQTAAIGNSSASQVSQQVHHQIRHRYRVQGPRQNIIASPGTPAKYRLIPRSEFEHRLNQEAQPEVIVGSSTVSSPIRVSTPSAHNSSSVIPVGRVSQFVRTVTPVAGHSVVSSQQLVKVVKPTESAVVSPTTPPSPLHFKVAVSNGQSTPVYKILYSVPPSAGLRLLTPLTVSNSKVISIPSGPLQVFRHATTPSAQTQQNSSSFKQITHQSLSIMGPTRQRFLRSKALPSVPNRLAIEPPPVVTIEDDVADDCSDAASSNKMEEEEPNGQAIVESDYYKLTVLKEPMNKLSGCNGPNVDKGMFRLRAQQLRIGSFVLRDRLVTISRNKLEIRARPVDSLTEVDLCFSYKDIVKVVWALSAETPGIICNLSPSCGELVREALHMQFNAAVNDKRCNDAKHPYFEPKAVLERQRQIVIILGESLSEEQYGLIQDCYLSPKGVPKKEFAERLLELTEPNTPSNIEETPLQSPDSTKMTGSSILFTPLVRKRRIGSSVPASIVTSNGIVTVSKSPAKDAQTPIKLPNDVIFTDDSIICRYPPSGKGGIVIRPPDLLTLLPETSVNDAVIDFYLSYIIGELLPKEKAEKIFAFNTFFYSSLVKAPPPNSNRNTGITESRRQHTNVKRWTKEVDLFTKDFILIPVCEHSHWFLIIVCYPWLVPKMQGIEIISSNEVPEASASVQSLTGSFTENPPDSSTGDSDPVIVVEQRTTTPVDTPPPRQRRSQDIKAGIFIFDSLRGTLQTSRIYHLIRNYLQEEFLAKKGVKCTFDWASMRGFYTVAPQQKNSYDCGIFLLEYARKFLLDPPDIKTLGSTNRFSEMFDPDLIMQRGRWEVAEVMFHLSEKQFPELKGVARVKYEHRIRVEGSTNDEDAKTPQSKRTRASNTPK